MSNYVQTFISSGNEHASGWRVSTQKTSDRAFSIVAILETSSGTLGPKSSRICFKSYKFV